MLCIVQTLGMVKSGYRHTKALLYMKQGKIACRALAAACETQHIVYVFLSQYSQVDLLVVTASSFCCLLLLLRD